MGRWVLFLDEGGGGGGRGGGGGDSLFTRIPFHAQYST